MGSLKLASCEEEVNRSLNIADGSGSLSWLVSPFTHCAIRWFTAWIPDQAVEVNTWKSSLLIINNQKSDF